MDPAATSDPDQPSPKGRILIQSSWCAFGHVGLSAGAPVLQALGYDVTQLPTIILSNHKGWPHCAGAAIAPDQLHAMVGALEANGWLDGHDGALIGYLPSSEHAAFAGDLVARLRRAERPPRVLVDPVLGDAPKGLYVPQDVAVSVRETLVPIADILTPNLFELGWLTGRPVSTLDETRVAARVLTREGGLRSVLVTSPPLEAERAGVLAIGPETETATVYRTQRLPRVPNGSGDVFAALIAAGLSPGAALGHLHPLLACSVGAEHLNIACGMARWTRTDEVASGPAEGRS